ncbi:MAG TPA: hypothetical protein VLA43_20630, partial [Longimicrobiales bacterium]|nr:hypothetical protein [Longimicrobiales bacterium]
RWLGELEERAEAGSPIVRRAWMLARGQAREDGPPMPARGASWREWRTWEGSGFPMSWRPDPTWALRIRAALTGEDPLGDWVASWRSAEDSARVFMGSFLRRSRWIPEASPREAGDLRIAGEPVPTGNDLGLWSLAAAQGEAVEAGEAEAVLEPLVRALLEGRGAPWPRIQDEPAGSGAEGRAVPPAQQEAERPRFLRVENVPESILRTLPPAVVPVTEAEWERRDRSTQEEALHLRPARRWGPFLILSWNWKQSHTLVIVETPEGWRVVGGMSLGPAVH